MQTLIITEKPSVAQTIAAVVGAITRKDGYIEGNGYIVGWCLGHLAQLVGAEAYD
ncbi:MAG: DNA topoisomerase, partial [Oscillospiraceae bacterium]